MGKTLLITLLLLSFLTRAQGELATGSGQAQQQGSGGGNSGPSLSVRTYEALINTDPRKRKASANCDSFIDSNGEFGAYGTRLIQAIRDVNRDCFYEKIDFSYLCPKYSTFNDQRKSQFLAFLFASMATFESSCYPTAQNSAGTNDVADGLFQLEYSQSARRAAGRHPTYCATQRSVDSQSLDFQMECSVSIFATTHCGTGRVPGKYSGDYWQKLRPGKSGDREITRLAKMFPHCN